MSQLDREGLISQSNALFPNNTNQEITPTDIRQFDLDCIDSFSLTGSLVVSASHAEFAKEAENAEHADAVQFPVIAKETLTKGDPVYVSGYNNGEGKPEVLKADASDSSKMPVVGLAMVNASNNDHIFIAVAGNFSNVDTDTGLTTPAIGDTLYVASGGGYTNVKPTGTNLIQNIGVIGRVQSNNGEIVVSAIQRTNDLPNIQNGYAWVGDGSGVPQAVATSSFAGSTIDTGSFATTGSNTFNGNQTISGSVTVSDPSATAVTITSGPGDDSPITIEGGTNVGEGKFTPSSIKGVESIEGVSTYGGNQLSGSWGQVGKAIPNAGAGLYNHQTASQRDIEIKHSSLGSPEPGGGTEIGYASLRSVSSAGNSESQLTLKGTKISLEASTGSKQTSVTVDGDVSASVFTGSFIGDATAALPNGVVSGSSQLTSSFDGRYAVTGSNTFNGTQTLSAGNSLTLLGGNVQVTGSVDALGGLVSKQNIEVINPSGNPYIRIGNTSQQYQFAGSEIYTNRTLNPGNVYAGFTVLDTGNSMNGGININTYTGIDGSTPVFQLFGGGGSGGNGQTILAAKDDSTVQFFKYNYFQNTTEFNNNIICNGPSEFRQNMVVSASIDTSGSVEAAVGKFDGVDSNVFYTNVGAPITFFNNVAISGSLTMAPNNPISADAGVFGNVQTTQIFSGTNNTQMVTPLQLSGKVYSDIQTVGISSNTASVDFAQAQMAIVTLPSSGNTNISTNNLGNGQVMNVLVKSTGTGTVTLANNILQPSGSTYVATTGAGGRDMITLSTFDNGTTSEVYLVNVTKFE